MGPWRRVPRVCPDLGPVLRQLLPERDHADLRQPRHELQWRAEEQCHLLDVGRRDDHLLHGQRGHAAARPRPSPRPDRRLGGLRGRHDGGRGRHDTLLRAAL